MRTSLIIFAATIAIGGVAHAGSQSSNTSSNSSSDNGVVRDRVVDTYCEDGYCTRSVQRRVYRDGSRDRRARDHEGRPYYDHRSGGKPSRDDRYERNYPSQGYYPYQRDHSDDDDRDDD